MGLTITFPKRQFPRKKERGPEMGREMDKLREREREREKVRGGRACGNKYLSSFYLSLNQISYQTSVCLRPEIIFSFR
jgi:hypothetical protein